MNSQVCRKPWTFERGSKVAVKGYAEFQAPLTQRTIPGTLQAPDNSTPDMVAACQGERIELFGQWHGVMRHKSSAATMDQTDIRGLVTTVHRSVMEAASL